MFRQQSIVGLQIGQVISNLFDQQGEWYNKQFVINQNYYRWISNLLQQNMIVNQQNNGFIVQYNKQLLQYTNRYNYIACSLADWIRFYFEQLNLKNQEQIDILLKIEPYGHFEKFVQSYNYALTGAQKVQPNQRFVVMLNYHDNNALIYNSKVLLAANKSALNARMSKINVYPISSIQGEQFAVVYNLIDKQIYLHKELLQCDTNHNVNINYNQISDSPYIKQNQQPHQIINYLYQTFGQNVSVIQSIIQQQVSTLKQSNYQQHILQENLEYNNSISLYNNIIIQANTIEQLNDNLGIIYGIFKYYPFGTKDPRKPLIDWYYDNKQQKYVEYKLIDTKWLQLNKQESNTFTMYCQNIQQAKTLFFGKSIVQTNSYQNMLSGKVENMIKILNLGYDLYCFTESDWIQQMIINQEQFQVDQNNNILFTAQNGTQYKCLYSGFYRQIEQINNIHLDSLLNSIFINLDKFNVIKYQQVNLGEVVMNKHWMKLQGVKDVNIFQSAPIMFNTALLVEIEQKSNQQHAIVVINYPTWNFNFGPIQILMFKYIEQKLQEFNNNDYPVIICGDQNVTPQSPCNMLLYQDSISQQQFQNYQEQQINTDPEYEQVRQRIYYYQVFGQNQMFSYQYLRNTLGMQSYYNQAYQIMNQDKSVENGFEYQNYFKERKLNDISINDLSLTTKTDGQFQDTLDYIYYSSKTQNLKPINFKENMEKIKILIDSAAEQDQTFPNQLSFSDHMPIVATFQLN